jgi:mannosyltransferase
VAILALILLQAWRGKQSHLQAWRSWPSMAALILILALAATVRCYRLSLPVLTVDEAFSWRLSQYPVHHLLQRTGADTHPPLHYLLLKGWLAVWGSSPFALRSLAVLCGVLAVLLAYRVCLALAASSILDGHVAAARGGALFSALLVAVHPSQVNYSRVERMYSLGVLLAALSAWLLLRALKCSQRQPYWWAAYGIGVAALCYVHTYAFLTVFAQATVILYFILGNKPGTRGESVPSPIIGFLGAGTLALLLYSPWIPMLFEQMDLVNSCYIGIPLSWERVADVFISWMIGLHRQDPGWAAFGFLALAAGAAGIVIVRRDRAGWFFLLQAVIPWLLALGVSPWFDRPIFVERGLAFAQFSLFGFWGVVWSRLSGWPGKLLLGCVLGIPSLYGLTKSLGNIPAIPPAQEAAMAWLKQNYQPGDVVLVAGPRALNRFRYYATQAGMTTIDVRCPEPSPASMARKGHSAALEGREVLALNQSTSALPCPRLWVVDDRGLEGQPSPPHRKWLATHSFEGGGGTLYELTLYGRPE